MDIIEQEVVLGQRNPVAIGRRIGCRSEGGKAGDLAFRLGEVIESMRFFRIGGSQFSRRVGPKAGQQRSGCSLPFEVNVRD